MKYATNLCSSAHCSYKTFQWLNIGLADLGPQACLSHSLFLYDSQAKNVFFYIFKSLKGEGEQVTEIAVAHKVLKKYDHLNECVLLDSFPPSSHKYLHL